MYNFRWTPQTDPFGIVHKTIDYPGVPVDHTGTAKLGARVEPGMFAQTHAHPEWAGRTLVDILWRGDYRRSGLDRGRAMGALRRYGLGDRADLDFALLSGGQQARFQILLIELSGATMLLLDEPSLGLAPLIAAQLMALLKDQTDGKDLTVVLVEQNARSALSVSHRAVVLNLGEVVISDTDDKVAADEDLRHHYLGF